MTARGRLLRFLAGAGTLALAAGSILGYAYFSRPSDGKPYIWTKHWTTMYASPATLPKSDFKGSALRKAATSWSVTPGTDFRFVVADTFHDATIGDLDGASDVYFADLGYYTLGICYVTDDSGRLVFDPQRAGTVLFDCDIAFHGYMQMWETGYFDFHSVALHELGHAQGLAHTNEDAAVMTPFLSPYESARVLHTDDVEGQVFLYPPPPGGGRGFPSDTLPLPTRFGTMINLGASRIDAMTGDPITFQATVTNTTTANLLFSGVQTSPSTVGEWEHTQMEPGEVREFSLERTVSGMPGEYETRLQLGGSDQVAVYLAQQTLLGDRLRVRRAPIPLEAQDHFAASLGPAGTDDLALFLPKGAQLLIEGVGAPQWGLGVRTVLLDPSGIPVPSLGPVKPFRARVAGVHRLLVANPTRTPGIYHIFTEGKRTPPPIRAKGTLDGSTPAEIPFPALARTSCTFVVKGSKSLAPRLTALRSPSGVEIPVPEGASFALDEFGEAGIWTAIVEGAPGVAGKATLKGSPQWIPGESTSF